MTSSTHAARTQTPNADAVPAIPFSRRRSLLAAAALFGLLAFTVVALSSSASATTCALGATFPYEVDDSYPAPNAAACQYQSFAQVALLPLAAGDVIQVHDGYYSAGWAMSTAGIAVIGDSETTVFINNSGTLTSPFSVRANNITLTNLTFQFTSWGLEVGLYATANDTHLNNLTIRNASSWSCVCYGNNMVSRNLRIYNVTLGYLTSGMSTDVDGLWVNTSASGGIRVYLQGSDVRVANATLWGVGGAGDASVLLASVGNNVTLTNVIAENTTYGIYVSGGSGQINMRGIAMRTNQNALYLESFSGKINLTNFIARDSDQAIYSAFSSGVLNLARASIENSTSTCVQWESGNDLTISDSVIRFCGADGIAYRDVYNLKITNVTLESVAVSSLYMAAGGLSWTGGSIDGTQYGVYLDGAVKAVAARNLSIINISDLGIFDQSSLGIHTYFNISIANVGSDGFLFRAGGTDYRVENSTVDMAGNNGINANSMTRMVLRNNTVSNVSYSGIYVYGTDTNMSGNRVSNAPYGFNFGIYPWDTTYTYNYVDTTNLLDGKPIYYLLNVSNISVPANANTVWIFNCTNVTVSGINQTAGPSGVFVKDSSKIRVSNSTMIGNSTGGAIVMLSSNVNFTNVSLFGMYWSWGIYLEGVTDASFANVTAFSPGFSGNALSSSSLLNVSFTGCGFAQFSDGFAVSSFTNVTLRDVILAQSGWNGFYFDTGSYLNITRALSLETQYGISLVTVSFVNISDSIFLNWSQIGIQTNGVDRLNVSNVTAAGLGYEGIYGYGANNVTVRNSTFGAQSGYGGYLYLSSDYRSFNSTYVGLTAQAVYVDFGSYNPLFIHNNFYGGGVSNGYGYGIWDGGWPAAGNYYDWAAGGFVDEKTGPGQTVAGVKDGISDSVYALGGGKNDNYPLKDPWPPTVALTSPQERSVNRAGTLLNFSISNFFDRAAYVDSAGGSGNLTYPHDLNTTGWADGWHNITITATDPNNTSPFYWTPTVVKTFSFEFDSTAPIIVATPVLGQIAVGKGAVINISFIDPHLNATSVRIGNTTTTGAPWYLIDTTNWTVGNYSVTVFANDTLNNSVTYVWNFYIDNVVPTISLTSPATDRYFPPGTQVTFAAADNFNLAAVTFVALETNGSWSYNGSAVANSTLWSLDTTGWQDGCYGVDVSARDAALWVTTVHLDFCTDSTPPDLGGFAGGFSTPEDVLFTFQGSLVNDLDWAPTFSWRFDDAILMAPVTLSGAAPSFTFATPGGYAITLIVTDRAGNSNSTVFRLDVDDMTDPVAALFVPAEWPEDVALPLDGQNSTDNDGYWDSGNTGNFTWDVAGASGSWQVYGRLAALTLDEPGTYTVNLTVTDGAGNTNVATGTVRILDTHAPTIAVTGTGTIRNEGDTVAFNAAGSTDNGPTSGLSFHWTFTYDGVSQSQSGAAFSFRFVKPGTYAIVLTVGDDAGNEASQTISQRINDIPSVANTPPATIEAGNIFEWSIQVVDTDSGDPRVFTLTSGPSGMTVSTGGVVQWATTGSSYGVYNIVVRISDGIASYDFSFVLQVARAAAGTNHPPYFSSFPTQTGTPGASYTYAATVADPDASDTVTLVLIEGPAAMTLDSSKTLHWQIPANATENTAFQVRLLLSDGLELVYQNFTIRVRVNNVAPQIVAGQIPATLDVKQGETVIIVLGPNMVTDTDDVFSNLTFYATAADANAITVKVGTNSNGQPVILVTGLRPGSTTFTLRVADPSGASQSQQVTATVASAAPAFDMTLLLLIAALVGAGILGIVVMKRRKKDEVPAPLAPAPAQEVQAEVIQVAPPAAAPPVAPSVALGAGVAGAAASAAVARAPPLVAAPAKVSKAATYVVEGVFVIYADGRMIYAKTDIGQQQLGDPELVSSMFTAVQQFIKDSFSAEGELNKMGYGENQILIERGRSLFMAVIVFGESDKELQETMQTAIEKMEYAYAGIVENWDGQQNRFKDISQYVAPILALTSGISRQDVLAATTTKDVKILSQLEFFQGFVRLKVGIKNDTEAVITKVTLDIDYNEDVLRLQRIEPATYKTSGARVMLNVLNTGEKSSVAYYFDPQICTETNIDGILRYRDYKGVLQSLTMKTRKAEVVCPLFFTKEHANTAMLKRLIESELQERDSKIYNITKLPPYVKHKDIFDVCKQVVLSHDVHMVREFVSYNPFAGEAWFYGETKVKGYKIVIRTAVREDNTIEFFAASSVIKAVTGLLAEFNHTLVSMIMERYSDVKIDQVYDENVKHQIQAKALVEKLGESEAGAGETEQK